MAWHEQSDDKPNISFEAMEEQSEQLAAEFKICPKRLIVCLTRLKEAYISADNRQDQAIHDATGLIRCAFSTLGENQGIRFLEEVDPVQLIRHVQTIELIRDELVPFFSSDELCEQFKRFLKFQDDTDQFLWRTGLPSATLEDSPWLFHHLGRLYDTRCTSSPNPRKPFSPTYRKGHDPLSKDPIAVDFSELTQNEPYEWVKYPTDSTVTLDEIVPCKYEEADYLPGLKPEMAEQLEAERAQIFEARRLIFLEIIHACKRGEDQGLLERCLNIFDRQLGRTTVLLMLRADRYYLGGDLRTPEHVEIDSSKSPGGLTNLVEVIGHVEIELRTKRIERLKNLISANVLNVILEQEEAGTGYFKTICTVDRETVDAALDNFSDEANQSWKHWLDIYRRFAIWLDPDYRVSLEVELQPKHAAQIASLLPIVITHMESKIEAGESPVTLPNLKTPNRFQYDGSAWNFTFDGKNAAHPNLDGFFYLAEILRYQDKGLSAVGLRQRLKMRKLRDHNLSKNTDKVHSGKGNVDGYDIDDLSVDIEDAGTLTDDVSLREYRTRLCDLEQDLATAEANGQAEDAAEIREEFERIKDHVDSVTNHHGKPRTLRSEAKKSGDAVRNAINRALEKLRLKHPSLHMHLTKYVKCGLFYQYEPPTPVDWEV